ncbi:MAG TPA: holo-ACP synthase [Eubacteriaceae bacterium]|nr:holo-ACP synthase [Eubacteriaceae bacterium]
MILGTGIDIIEIKRIEGLVNKREKFIERFFTPGEKEYLISGGKIRMESVAGYFAAKEAISKSMGTGFSGFKWQDIEIQKNSQGQPQVLLKGKAEEMAKQMGIENIIISISHSSEYAIAQAIALGNNKN